jgi:outer membrane immunogenic protein
MQRSILALALALLTAPAVAADMPVKAVPMMAPAYNWTGFYVGLNAGVAWGQFDPTTTTVFSPTGYFALSSTVAIGGAGNPIINPSAFTGGGQVGYNWQIGWAVIGLEADYESFRLSGTATSTTLYPCCAPTAFTLTTSTNTNWLFTARPRLGIAVDNWMFYGTGGVAVTDLHGNFTLSDTFATAAESGAISNTRTGWVAGAGGELGWGHWSFKAEVLFLNFGNVTVTSTNLTAFTPPIAFPTNVFTHTMDLKAAIARGGINYRF